VKKRFQAPPSHLKRVGGEPPEERKVNSTMKQGVRKKYTHERKGTSIGRIAQRPPRRKRLCFYARVSRKGGKFFWGGRPPRLAVKVTESEGGSPLGKKTLKFSKGQSDSGILEDRRGGGLEGVGRQSRKKPARSRSDNARDLR